MYSDLKKIFWTLVPRKYFYSHIEILRYPFYLLHKGSKYECPICDAQLKKFQNQGNEGNRVCPKCGSLDRHRRLWQLFQNEDLLKGKVLDFSPSPFFKNRLDSKLSNNYVTTDFEDEFNADLKLDITNITLPDGSFDTVICYHVLEHIVDDASAIRELYRVLANNGLLIVQTPFTNGELEEDLTITNPKLRFEKYGQSDHVRLYNVSTLLTRLVKAGFEVETRMFKDEQDNKFGLKTTEYILLAKKL